MAKVIWEKCESNLGLSASMLLSLFYTIFDICIQNAQPSFCLR